MVGVDAKGNLEACVFDIQVNVHHTGKTIANYFSNSKKVDIFFSKA